MKQRKEELTDKGRNEGEQNSTVFYKFFKLVAIFLINLRKAVPM